jgi:serine/threonine protein kinase
MMSGQSQSFPWDVANLTLKQMLSGNGNPLDDLTFELRWLNSNQPQCMHNHLKVGDTPIGIEWKTEEGFGIDCTTGEIFASPEQERKYSTIAWLIAVDANRPAAVAGLPPALDKVLLKQWNLTVKDPQTFDVTSFSRKDPHGGERAVVVEPVQSSTLMHKTNLQCAYAESQYNHTCSIEQVLDNTLKPPPAGTVTYTVDVDLCINSDTTSAPDFALLINPKTGYMNGKYTADNSGKSLQRADATYCLAKLSAVNNNKGTISPLVIETFNITFKPDDRLFAENGPHHKACQEGSPYDETPFNQKFTCTCNSGYAGDNCEKQKSLPWFVALGTTLGLAVLLAVMYVHRARQLRLQAHDFKTQLEDIRTNGELPDSIISLNVPREIKWSAVIMSNKIGVGGFGEVWKGLLDESSHGGLPGYLVAVKVLKDNNADGAGTAELLREASLMALVEHHKQIVGLVGVVTSGTPLLLLLTYCENGALSSCLKKREVPINKSKLEIGLDIALGMEHLTASNFVHCDLAARNVLLDTIWTAKVADFGLSRITAASESMGDNAGDDLYYKSTKGTFAVRWTAPDTMETLRYSTASDVWSFGVVLFEIYANGARPYAGMDNAAVITDVMAGYRMPQPEECSNVLYATMLRCWAAAPTARPSFTELVRALTTELRNVSVVPPTASSIIASGGQSAAAEQDAMVATTEYNESLYQRIISTEDEYIEIVDTNSSSPLAGLAATPLVGLREAVAVAEKHLTCAGGLSAQVEEAFAFAISKVHSGRSQGLTVEQVAAINLYTQESPFYKGLNGALGGWGSGGQAAIHNYLLYIKIAMGALAALPQFETTVYRGIRGVSLETLLKGKGIGDVLAWWAFTSTTGTSDVLRDPMFFGVGAEHGERVVFVMEVKSGVQVKSFSALGSILEYYLQPFGSNDKNEDEYMLRPGAMFEIDSITSFTTGVTEVKMHEVPNPDMVGLIGGGANPIPSAAPETNNTGGTGYMLVSATGPPQQQERPSLSLVQNNAMHMGAGGNASSSDEDSDQFQSVDRISSSTGLLGESEM